MLRRGSKKTKNMDHMMVNHDIATEREFMFCTWLHIRMERLFLELSKGQVAATDMRYFARSKFSRSLLHKKKN